MTVKMQTISFRSMSNKEEGRWETVSWFLQVKMREACAQLPSNEHPPKRRAKWWSEVLKKRGRAGTLRPGSRISLKRQNWSSLWNNWKDSALTGKSLYRETSWSLPVGRNVFCDVRARVILYQYPVYSKCSIIIYYKNESWACSIICRSLESGPQQDPSSKLLPSSPLPLTNLSSSHMET